VTTILATADSMREQIRRSSKLKGRQPDAVSLAEVEALIGPRPQEGYRRDLLIEHLHRLNDAHRGLLERHLVALAKLMNLAMAEVYEVATFYHHFDIIRGDHEAPALTIRVCSGLSCALARGEELLQRLPALLGRTDLRVIAAPCVGRCEQAPVAVVDQFPVAHATPERVIAAVQTNRSRHPKPADDGNWKPSQWIRSEGAAAPLLDPVEAVPVVAAGTHTPHPSDHGSIAPAYTGYASYRTLGGYALAASVAASLLGPDSETRVSQILQTLDDSGLRGLGGAGFQAGRKWRIVREQPGPRLMAVNIDEGEPGTFKDRTYLERDPHRFLEGMLIAAQVVGIESCYIYLRDEYHGCRDILQTEIARLHADPPCPLPHIELRRGAGAYICGEESAMIESIEGKRGEPRMRPPYIAQIGLFGRPTLEHNFETLYWVRDILERGAAWFSDAGRHGRRGLRSFSVSGRVQHPGVKLAPAGITLNELIREYCGGMLEGHILYAYLPGGASGGIFPATLADVPLDFDTLQPHGGFIGSAAVIVLSQHDHARDAALNMMQFFAHESCGQCTPCRVGTAKAAQLMQAPTWDLETLEDLNKVMEDASICGLGQAAPNPVRCVQHYFAHEVR